MPRPTSKRSEPVVEQKSVSKDSWKFNIIILILLFQTGVLLISKYDEISDFIGSKKGDFTSFVPDGVMDDLDTLTLESSKLMSNLVVIKPQMGEKKPNLSEDETKIPFERKIRVQVLNGCGVRGIAGKWDKILKKANYDVREIGNYDGDNLNETIIISRVDDMSFAYSLAKKIGINDDKVILQKKSHYVDYEIELVIGNDHTKLKKPVGNE